MKHLRITAALIVVLAAGSQLVLAPGSQLVAATEPSKAERPKAYKLDGAASSIDDLFARFFAALAHKDPAALERLRINEREYREFVLPGSSKEGQPPQIMSDRDSKFFWDMLNTKSTYASWALLSGYSGRTFTLKHVEYEKGVKKLAWYTAYRDPQLTLEDANGQTVELPVGAIADIDGQYKFIGFNSDD